VVFQICYFLRNVERFVNIVFVPQVHLYQNCKCFPSICVGGRFHHGGMRVNDPSALRHVLKCVLLDLRVALCIKVVKKKIILLHCVLRLSK
jgi:hypothetical protein